MGKKKKKKRGVRDDEPDPRRVALGNHIGREVEKREKEEESNKKTLQPLKRVTSNPIVYEFVPMARNMFSDSKSVDYGFDGSVDVPNQVVYMEELPDDDTWDKDLPDGLPSVTSIGNLYSTEIDDDEFEWLENLETSDTWRFLKSRIGKEKFDELRDSPQYEAILTMIENTTEEDDSVVTIGDDMEKEASSPDDSAGRGWLGLPSLFGGWWSTPEEEKKEDVEVKSPSLESLSQDAEDETSRQPRKRTAKERWLLHRSRLWHRSQGHKKYETTKDEFGRPVSRSGSSTGGFSDGDSIKDAARDRDPKSRFSHSLPGNDGKSSIGPDDQKKLVDSRQKEQRRRRLANKKKERKRKCLIPLLILLAVIVLGVAGTFVAAYLGIQIPFVSEIMFPQTQDGRPSVNGSAATGSNVTYPESLTAASTESTRSVVTTTTRRTITIDTTEFETEIESLSEIESLTGISLDDYKSRYPYLLAIVTGDLRALNGEAVTYYSVPVGFKDKLGLAIYDAFRYLGFEVGALEFTGNNLSNRLRITMFVYARPESNLGVMKWYGFTKSEAFSRSSAFIKRMRVLLPKVFYHRRKTVLERFYYTVSSSFTRPAYWLLDTIELQRPPARIPDEWGNCDGVSLCELDEE